jgi:hypothetical protein
MFSATGGVLTGSQLRPDTYTISIKESKGFSSSSSIASSNCTLNKLGYTPVVSTITGCGRALLGVIHSIVHLASAIFDAKNRAHHLEETKLGGKNIGRGLVEMLPIIGNITMFVVDLKRMNKFEKQAKEIMAQNPDDYNNHITLFAYGKEIANHTKEAVQDALKSRPKNTMVSEIMMFDLLKDMQNI